MPRLVRRWSGALLTLQTRAGLVEGWQGWGNWVPRTLCAEAPGGLGMLWLQGWPAASHTAGNECIFLSRWLSCAGSMSVCLVASAICTEIAFDCNSIFATRAAVLASVAAAFVFLFAYILICDTCQSVSRLHVCPKISPLIIGAGSSQDLYYWKTRRETFPSAFISLLVVSLTASGLCTVKLPLLDAWVSPQGLAGK